MLKTGSYIMGQAISFYFGQLCEHKHGDAFSIHWQQYR